MHKAQKATQEYHQEFFKKAELFKEGTWIAKSEDDLLNLVRTYFSKKQNVQILDLGCGVGRNAIPMAKIIGPNGGKVMCVDVLQIAIEKLKENAEKYGVAEYLQYEVQGVEEFFIKEDSYDLILAFSVLEHGVSSEQAFFKVIENIKNGTKKDGLNYLGITTNLQELDAKTHEELPKDIVYDASYEKAKADLEAAYIGWQILPTDKSFYTEQYVKNGKMIIWQSDFLTFVVKN
ncbi:MAG: class I SAM-dependent methyltransferase [Candidatus Roizmanbacteria bacterium]|nr:class I SAM-dependent methyltransferase [Candidatus Roizmanbacteria bacterium]